MADDDQDARGIDIERRPDGTVAPLDIRAADDARRIAGGLMEHAVRAVEAAKAGADFTAALADLTNAVAGMSEKNGRSAGYYAWSAFAYADVFAGCFRWSPARPPPHDLSDPDAEGIDPGTAAAIRKEAARYKVDGDRLRWAMATEVLEAAQRGGCHLANPADNGQREALVAAFEEHAPKLREAAGMHLPSPTTDDDAKAIDPDLGILRWDAGLVRYLEGLGAEGKVAAEKARNESTDPGQLDWTIPAASPPHSWRLLREIQEAEARGDAPGQTDWINDGAPAERLWGLWVDLEKTPRAWFLLGISLWFDVVRAGFRFIGTMDLDPFRGVVTGLRPGNRAGARDGRQLELLSADDRMVGVLDLRALKAIRAGSGGEMVKALSSPAGHQLVARGSKMIARQLAQGIPNPYRTALPGRSELRAVLGNIQSKELDALLEGAQAFRSEGPGWTIRGLFTYAEYRSSGGGKGSTGRPAEIVLSWNAELFTGRGLMVPLPDPDRGLPDIGARNRGKVEHAIWCLYSLAQEHSRDLFLYGDAPITDADWRQIQKETGLTKRSLDRLRGGSDDDGG